MATSTFEAYIGAGPAWADIGANTVVFSSSLTDLATNVTVAQWQDGTHLGNGDPGTDQCGANHMNNVKFLTTTTFALNGGGSETLNDTNLVADECTMRLHFNHGSAVALSSGVFYCFDPSTSTTTPAVGVDVYGFEQGEGNTTWVVINDETTSGALTTGGIGGNNSGERIDLTDKSAATDNFIYLAISVSPETVGGKTDFDFGWEFIYS